MTLIPAPYVPAADARGDWMRTYTGRKFYPLAPCVEDIDIRDIAHALSQICRYGGHTTKPYSVAEHCVAVSLMVPAAYARQALLHDAAEAYVGDMVRPLKHHPLMKPFRDAEAAVEACVYTRFNIRPTETSNRLVKAIDDRILADEQKFLNGDKSENSEWMRKLVPLDIALPGLSAYHAEYIFCARFAELFPELLDEAR